MDFISPSKILLILMWLQRNKVTHGTPLIKSGGFRQEDASSLDGTAVEEVNIRSILECSMVCLRRTQCTEFLFNVKQRVSAKCQIIQPGNGSLNLDTLKGYKHYVSSARAVVRIPTDLVRTTIDLTAKCPDTYNADNSTGLPKPVGWDSGCPDFYFSLDNYNGMCNTIR